MSTPPRRTPPRLLQVVRTRMLTPSLKRITLGGEALRGFPQHSDGAHIKLMFPRSHQRVPVLPTLGPDGPLWPPEHERPVTRTYSVSHYDTNANELDVDVVLHGDNGPASRWAINACTGDAIGVAGPGGPERIKPGADWYLLVADPSAIGALQAALSALDSTARGYAFIEVENEQDILPLHHPQPLNIQWLLRGETPAGDSTLLFDAIRQMRWLLGTPSIMLAGENSQVIAIRDFVLQQKKVPRKMLYAVPYWKDRHTEESYHQERHRIMDELERP